MCYIYVYIRYPVNVKLFLFAQPPLSFYVSGPSFQVSGLVVVCCLLSAVVFRTFFCLFPCTFTYVYSITCTYPYVYVCDLILFLVSVLSAVSGPAPWSWSGPGSGPGPDPGCIALHTFYKTYTVSFR